MFTEGLQADVAPWGQGLPIKLYWDTGTALLSSTWSTALLCCHSSGCPNILLLWLSTEKSGNPGLQSFGIATVYTHLLACETSCPQRGRHTLWTSRWKSCSGPEMNPYSFAKTGRLIRQVDPVFLMGLSTSTWQVSSDQSRTGEAHGGVSF